ncbi:copper chaperone PCu(A)C [Streptomyces mirabilis]|uniref:copper chaperone PCu(A)C n=1 Tax=Streptomyces mirabilis TaxID=68239 RepID=UPI0036DE1216
MTGQLVWHPTRRRLTDTLLAALAPVAVCGLALGGLSTWTAYGNAGSPARITVTGGRVYLPYGDAPDTAAFFRITNNGGSADRLLKVTSRAVDGAGTLSRHRMTGTRSASAQTVASVAVPAGGTLAPESSSICRTTWARHCRSGSTDSTTCTARPSGQAVTPS